jgi:hypothetical protein
LRLFLALVASAEQRDQLNHCQYWFNLLPGNSLIGAPCRSDEFDAGSNAKEGDGRPDDVCSCGGRRGLGNGGGVKTAPTAKEKVEHLAGVREQIRAAAREKNRLVDLYKRSALDFRIFQR